MYQALTAMILATKNTYQYLQFQRSLLSLAPPMRTTKVHFEPQSPIPPIVSWILEHQAFKRASGEARGILHLHAGEKSGLDIGAISQHLSFAYDIDNAWDTPASGVFYFQFDRRDGRYNNIKTMISSYLNTFAWRFLPEIERDLAWLSGYLDIFQTWSLEDVIFLFFYFRRPEPIENVVIFLSSFDQCDETQRRMFLEKAFKYQSHCERHFQLIVSTSSSEDFLCERLTSDHIINLEEYPFPAGDHSAHTKPPGTFDLETQSLLEKRRVFGQFDTEISHLMRQCEISPYLGYRILQWLEHYGRGVPVAEIACTIGKLSPVTPQNTIQVFLDSLNKEKQQRMNHVLCWVRCSAEPLTTEMLAQAVAVHMFPEEPPLADIDYDYFYQDLQQSLGGIIVRDGLEIKFSDDAFYDLPPLDGEGDQTEEQTALIQGEIARTCLNHILCVEGQDTLATISVDSQRFGTVAAPPLMLPRDSLVGYALRYWPVHYQASGKHRPVDVAMRLFQDTFIRRNWAEALYVTSNPFTRIHRSYFSPLPYMAMLGLGDLVLMQIKTDKGSRSFTRDCWMAITEAARNGHETTLNLLLSHVEVHEAGLRETLHWAALYGRREVVDMLIAETQKIRDFQWPRFILARAAAAGLDNLVSALVDAGYDMNEEDASGTSRHAIHLAAFLGQDRVIALLAHGGADLTLRDQLGKTPLRIAVQSQPPETVQYLVTNTPCNINDKNFQGTTIVQHAVAMGEHKSLEILIEAGADFESGDMNAYGDLPWFRIPIVQAAGFGYKECVRVLLEHGADPNAYSQQGSALYVAITDGPHVEICRMLLEKGANPNQSSADNDVYIGKDMLLLRAIRTGNEELVSLLLDKGAIVDSVDPNGVYYDTPLSYAIAFSTFEMVELLIRRGADVNFVSENEETGSPLYSVARASFNTNHKYVDLLVNHGANVHWRHRIHGQTPLVFSYDSPDLIRSLLKHGSDINAVSYQGWTTLMNAAHHGVCTEVVEILLQHVDPKADLEIQGNDGWNALSLASSQQGAEVVQLLLEAGANVNQRSDSGSNSLTYCLYNADSESSEEAVQVLKLLLKFEASVDIVDKFGDTVLHNIRHSTPLSAIKILVEAGAPVNMVNDDGYTPLGLAVMHDNVEAAEYLLTVDGVRVDVCHPEYGSILHMAVRSSSPLELTKHLIAAGADYTALNSATGESVLSSALGREYSAKSTPSYAWYKMLRYLVEELHLDVNAHGGQPPYPILQLLNASHDTNTLKYLIRKGARLDVTDELGRGPAHYAAMRTSSEATFAALIKAKADFLLKDNYGRTPLHFAAANSDLYSFKYLLKKLSSSGEAFDVDVTDVDGWTPLMWLCRRWVSISPDDAEIQWLSRYGEPFYTRLLQCSRKLVHDYGSSIWARSQDGEWSPLKVARFNGWDCWMLRFLKPKYDYEVRQSKNGQEETWDPENHIVDVGALPVETVQCLGCFMVRFQPPLSNYH